MSTHQKDNSDAMSTASTLVPPSPTPQSSSSTAVTRTTLTGNPITYHHDSLSNTTNTGFISNVGANTLPPGYTDTSLVHIPIKTGQYLNHNHNHHQQTESASDPPSEIKRPKPSKGVWERLSKRMSGSHDSRNKSDDEGLKVVAMSRGDYLKYWAKGEDGEFKAGVVEPEGGRADWLRRALERQERLGIGKVVPSRTLGSDKSAVVFGAAGALIGGACC
jgi:hypothetical protein